MNVTRFVSAPTYIAPNHVGMHCLRLQGHEAGPSETLWMGISHLLPGGHTGFDASAVEKHYVVLEGVVTVVTEQGEATLTQWDSCRIAPGEKRRLENRATQSARILLAMPYPPTPTDPLAMQSAIASTPEALIRALGAMEPTLANDAYVAPSATLIGDVHLGPQASVWFGAVLRGDNASITIGEGSNIQDNAVLHADPGFPLAIEDGVSVGHLAMLHGCTIGAGSLIGIGAVVLNGTKIGSNCLIAAKALIPEGKVIPDNSIVRGMPARVVGQVTEEHLAMMRRAAESYVQRAARYSSASSTSEVLSRRGSGFKAT
jgi:carbonic anhydrase/acetyltransferase-like protein (isoleucine patch superfamily)/quercetin dioxygenase-like cupin family protein